MTTKVARVTFSDEEKKELQRAALAVWDECAYDLLQAVAEERGKNINDVTIPRSHVIEIALDAGRAEERLRRGRDRKPGVLTDDFFKRLEAADYETLIAAVKPAFPYARYGM